MLRQRRYPQRNSLQNSLNIYSNQNFTLFDSAHEGRHFYPSKPRQSRKGGLTQIFPNNATEELFPKKEGQTVSKSHFNQSGGNNLELGPSTRKCQEQDNIFYKINQLIKHEESGLPICHSFKQKKVMPRERPYTSLSNRNKRSHEPSVHRYQVVLDLTPKEESVELCDPSKVSTSRALMNYSKVFRNSSGERFKVKRDKQYYNQCSMISAQKVILNDKGHPRQKQRILVSKPRKSSSKIEKPSQQHRYQEEEEYQIQGWDYFE